VLDLEEKAKRLEQEVAELKLELDKTKHSKKKVID